MPTATDYYDAARELMADGDPSRVTIDALCTRLGTTSGSFYHHFGSQDGFIEALAGDWVERIARALEEAAVDPSDLVGARRRMNDQLLRQPHQQEAAFRAWARTSPAMRAAVTKVDKMRVEVSHTMVLALDPELDAPTAAAYADISNLVVIGAQTHNPDTAAKVGAKLLAAFASLIERAGSGQPTEQAQRP